MPYEINGTAANALIDDARDGIPIVQSISSWLHNIISHGVQSILPFQIPELATTAISVIVVSLMLYGLVSKLTNHAGKVILIIVFLAVFAFMVLPIVPMSG